MKLLIPVTLKMAYNPFQPVTSDENPQKDDISENPFEKVVDPLTEFHVPITSHDKNPNDAFNLPRRFQRKSSSTSLYSKLDYYVDHNELPRVHRTLSNQSLQNATKDKSLSRNILTSNSLDFGSFNSINILTNNNNLDAFYNQPNIKFESLDNSDRSECATPVPQDFAPLSPIEKYETASNVSSNITDVPCSILSSISDIDTNKVYENTIKELRIKLEESQAQNETYKFALKDLEWKTELNWQEKYQELMRQKANCEGQLNTLQTQYDGLLKDKQKFLFDTTKSEQKNALFEEYTRLQSKLNNIEKINSELYSKLILSQNESKQFQMELSKIESENEKLRVNLQEIKIDLDSKNSVLHGLKNKITEQHIELQNQIQAKLKLNNFVTSLNNEIDSIKKSEKWYIDQLHACQYAKSKIQQELMSTQSNLILNAQKTETLKSEVAQWKNQSEEIRKKAIREKEKMLRKMEVIEADLIEREALRDCTQDTKIEYKIDNTQDLEQKLLIEEYEDRINVLNKNIHEKDELIQILNKQNADYLVRVTTLQKMLNEKELHYQNLENANSGLEMKCNNYNENLRTKDNQLLDLRNKIVNLEVALHAANREKEEIDEVIKNVREDFNKFMKCYNNMKETLEEKSKIISTFECEKQELFMENNWRVCEIEELQQKVLTSKGIQAEFIELKNTYNESLLEKEKLVEENNYLKSKLKDFEKDFQNEEYEKVIESLTIREEQLYNQTQNCDLLNNEIKDKENQLIILKDEIEKVKNSFENENFKVRELKDINIALELQIQDLHKKITDSNLVIEQFNNLCKNSEWEKHDLAQQLELIKKEKFITNIATQTDILENINLQNIKSKLNELFDSNNINLEQLNTENIFDKMYDYLNLLLELKKTQNQKIEFNQKVIKTLKNKLLIAKNRIQDKVSKIEERCYFVVNNFEDLKKQINFIFEYIKMKNSMSSVEIQTDEESGTENTINKKEVRELKNYPKGDTDKYEKYEKNKSTLLRKLKEELRARKTAEKNLNELQETYSFAITEINDLKLANNRTEIEFETLKSRCNEYKEICDKLNDTIVNLEKEKGENAVKEHNDCEKCVEMKKIKEDLYEMECKFKTVKDKLFWYEKEITDKEQGITECKKQLFNEKLQSSALKKQLSSVQMCLDNANSLLDTKQVEFSQLKLVCDKLESSKMDLADQLETEQIRYQECKKKLDDYLRLLEEQTAKDDLLADEIKTISCHLHQKNLELSNAEGKINILENEYALKIHTLENTITELRNNLSEIQNELEAVRNDKFFLQRLCADLKMSLQGTINQNKVLQMRLDSLQAETNNKIDSSQTVDDDYINRLLKESIVLPDRPLLNLRSCLDSLKSEMAILQQEVINKTQNVSF